MIIMATAIAAVAVADSGALEIDQITHFSRLQINVFTLGNSRDPYYSAALI